MQTPKSVPTPSNIWAEIMAFVTMLLSWFHGGPPQPVKDVFAKKSVGLPHIPSWLWTIIVGLISKAPGLVALVEADIAAGKTFLVILEDILNAILGPNPPVPPPVQKS